MTDPADRVCVLVLGMHRSGTSALTRVLNLLGCDSAEHLLEANDGNARGYWESRPIMEMNNRILKSGGSEWFDCERFNPNWPKSIAVNKFRSEAKATLKAEFGDSDLFVLKDPRVCILLPFWLSVLEECGIKTVGILTLRHPLEVAASLERQHNFQTSHNLFMWLRYMLEAERETRNIPRFFTSYDQLLNEPGSFVNRSQSVLDLSWPRNSLRTIAEIEEFLSVALRNHVQPSTRQMRLPVAQEWIRTTYDIFNKWVRTGTNEEDYEALDNIYREFNIGIDNFGSLINDNSQMAEVKNRLLSENELRRTEIEKLESILASVVDTEDSNYIAELQQQLKMLDAKRLVLERKNVALEKGVIKLQRELADRPEAEAKDQLM